MDEEFRTGDKVIVPWGLDELLGEVVGTYPSALGLRVVVRFEIPGAPAGVESTSVTLPASVVAHAFSNETPAASGSWAPPLHYERLVLDALRRVFQLSPRLEMLGIKELKGSEVDFVARLSETSRLFVEVKYRSLGKVSTDTVMQLAQMARRHEGETFLLLVTNTSLTNDAVATLSRLKSRGTKFRAVKWQGEEDDSKLEESLQSLLAA